MSPVRVLDAQAGHKEFAEELERRSSEVVFVTADAGGAEALRGWGLLALARPSAWDGETLGLLARRDVAVIVHGPKANPEQAKRDAEALAGAVRRVGVLVPRESPQHAPTRDLGEYVRRQRTIGLGSQVLLMEAQANLRGQVPRVEPEEVQDEWPPLRLGERPLVEPFPLDVLPDTVAEFVAAVARDAGAPVDSAAVPALVAAGAAIGGNAALAMKPGHCVYGTLHALNVGEPSDGGSRAMYAAIQALRELGGVPVATEQDLVRWLDNPGRGLLVAREDATTWLSDLSAPRKREGEPSADLWHHALRGVPGGARKTPLLSFCGSVAPEVLGQFGRGPGRGRLGGSRGSELLDHMLVVLPDPVPTAYWSDESVPKATTDAWFAALKWLRLHQPAGPPGDGLRCELIAFTEDAKAAWVAWYNARTDEFNAPGCDPLQRAAECQLRDITARLALIVHLLDVAFDRARKPGDPLPPLGVESLRKGLRLWSYFRAQQRRVRWEIGGGTREPVAGAIVDWIRRTGRTHFSVSELTDALRWLRARPDEPESALEALEAYHAIRRRADAPRPAGSAGRKHSPIYDVHPALVGQKGGDAATTERRREPISDFSDISEPFSSASTGLGPSRDRQNTDVAAVTDRREEPISDFSDISEPFSPGTTGTRLAVQNGEKAAAAVRREEPISDFSDISESFSPATTGVRPVLAVPGGGAAVAPDRRGEPLSDTS